MARREEKIEEKKQKSNPLFNAAKIAGALGIGYVGVKRIAPSFKMAQAKIGSNSIIKEVSSDISRAVGGTVDTIGGGQGFIKTPINFGKYLLKDTEQQFQKNISRKAKESLTRKINENPNSLKQLSGALNQSSNNRKNAERVSIQNNLKKILSKEDNIKEFGDDAQVLNKILKKKEYSSIINQRRNSVKDGNNIQRDIVSMVDDYHMSSKRNRNKTDSLNFDKKFINEYADKVMAVIDEAKDLTRIEKLGYDNRLKNGKSLKNNKFAEEMKWRESLSFKAARESRLNKNNLDNSRINTMARKGYKPVSMGEALDIKLDDGKTIAETYPHLKYEAGKNGTVQENIAKTYIRKAQENGISSEKAREDIFAKELFINPKTRDFLDFSGWDDMSHSANTFMKDHFQVPILNFNPQDIMQYNARQQKANAPLFHTMRTGVDISSPFLEADKFKTLEAFETRNIRARSKELAEDVIFSYDKIYTSAPEGIGDMSLSQISDFIENQKSDFIIDEGVSLVNVKTGIYKKHGDVLSGRSNIEIDERPGAVGRLFGMGQEQETIFSRWKRSFSKFDDPYYGANLVDTITGPDGLNEEIAEESIGRMYSLMNGQSRDFSSGSREASYDILSNALKTSYDNNSIDMYDMTTPDGIISTAQKIINGLDEDRFKTAPLDLEDGIQQHLEKKINSIFNFSYGSSDGNFFNSKRYLKDKNIVSGEMISAMSFSPDREVEAVDDLKRLIEELSIASANKQGVKPKDLIKNAIENNTYTDIFEKELYNLDSLSKVDYFKNKIGAKNTSEFEKNLFEFRDFLEDNVEDTISIHNSLKKADPWYGTGIGKDVDALSGEGAYTVIKQHRTALQSINESLRDDSKEKLFNNDSLNKATDVAQGVLNYGKQGKSLFAGPKNFDDVSTMTSFSWFFGGRLNDAVAQIGLGLSNDLMETPQAIFMNQFVRKIALPYMAFQQLNYLDGLTGDKVSDAAADTYVNMHKDVSSIKEKLGLNRFGKYFRDTMPGLDQIEELAPVKAFNFATFGLFSDTRSGEEVQKYYESGEDAVRKGRNWGIGSNSMYMGSKIDRYEPNWYRKMKSDYMFSENMYGSEKEYWANNFMPTLTNPLAPLRHFVTDPYHYENKHQDSRPYAVTGGFAELHQIPLIGPVVDSAASSILKPNRYNPKLKKSHREYLRTYNESLIESYVDYNVGGLIEGKPSGGVSMTPVGTDVNLYDEDGVLDEDELTTSINAGGREGYMASIASMYPQFEKSSGTYYSQGQGGISGVPVNRIGVSHNYFKKGKVSLKDTLTIMNQNLTDNANNSGANSISKAGTLEDPNVIYNLNTAVNNNSLMNIDGPWREVMYNASESAGLFGFLAKAGANWEEANPRTMLQSSDQFSSYSRSFWDKELGGLGGDISEIFRRYVPRDPNNRNYYNPIRNTMPGWLPGQEYFTDFQHGDPYVKIAHGEMRLPGEAYEKLYNVKKDENGNYSAFDRYRILSDVAPYSDQYRMAKKEMSILNANNMLDDTEKEEYAEIREQVQSKKKKHHFYPNKFRNADVIEQNVTVKRIINANTFLTEEYGNNPIKFAGINVKSDDEESINLISQFIKPGQRLKIALDADANSRVRNDMMDTMRAVVYTPTSAEGSMMGLMGIGAGTNLNYALSKKSKENGGTVTVRDDGSAIATQALYSEGQITMGKFNEWMVHDALPNIPILGIFADKFLQVRSPVEAYERELYSKNWRDWKNPIQDWLKPMVDSTISRNPLISTTLGYGIGWLAGRKNREITGIVAGLTLGVMSGARTLEDQKSQLFGNGEVWIPERRELERDVDDYFDKIKYVKYKGLYERAKQLAKSKEGFDLDKHFEDEDIRGKKNKNQKSYLENKKKWLSIDKKSGYGNQNLIDNELAQIKEDLSIIDEDRPEGAIGSYTALAMRYKEEFESTLYGADSTNDFRKIYKALPSKDKQYFTEFSKASPEERQKIIKLVPKNQRRIYQQQWNMEVDKKESLFSYFQEHNLPDSNWEGWDPSTSLDSIKVKVMQKAGIELTESNYWDDDVAQAEDNNAKAIDIDEVRFSQRINLESLTDALRGSGLKDVRVTMTTSRANENKFKSNIKLEKDRRKEIEERFKSELLT